MGRTRARGPRPARARLPGARLIRPRSHSPNTTDCAPRERPFQTRAPPSSNHVPLAAAPNPAHPKTHAPRGRGARPAHAAVPGAHVTAPWPDPRIAVVVLLQDSKLHLQRMHMQWPRLLSQYTGPWLRVPQTPLGPVRPEPWPGCSGFRSATFLALRKPLHYGALRRRCSRTASCSGSTQQPFAFGPSGGLGAPHPGVTLTRLIIQPYDSTLNPGALCRCCSRTASCSGSACRT